MACWCEKKSNLWLKTSDHISAMSRLQNVGGIDSERIVLDTSEQKARSF